MIQQECIDELVDMVGVGECVVVIIVQVMNGELNFYEVLIVCVGLLVGFFELVVDQVLDSCIILIFGGCMLIVMMKVQGVYMVLVLGGFMVFIGLVLIVLGFDEYCVNMFLVDQGVLIGYVVLLVLGCEVKVDVLNDIVVVKGLMFVDVLVVGDGVNDLGML